MVYWSGTGNTEAMAQAVVTGAKEKGAEVVMFTASEFDASMMDQFDAIAFGCPSMGAEQLEETEFERCFLHARVNCQVKKLPCLARTAGGTANGCATGRNLYFRRCCFGLRQRYL